MEVSPADARFESIRSIDLPKTDDKEEIATKLAVGFEPVRAYAQSIGTEFRVNARTTVVSIAHGS